MEQELKQLRSECAYKDQQIADLKRAEVSTARIKKDMRQLVGSLHEARKELWRRRLEQQDSASASRDSAEGESPGRPRPGQAEDAGQAALVVSLQQELRDARQLSDDRAALIARFEDENGRLKQSVDGLQSQVQSQQLQQPHQQPQAQQPQQTRQPSGVSAQKPTTADSPHTFTTVAGISAGTTVGTSAAAAAPRAVPYLGGLSTPGGQVVTILPDQHEQLQPFVYSNLQDHGATVGVISLQGIGTVDGVASAAKVLLQRIQSSVCNHQRRAGGVMMALTPQQQQQLAASNGLVMQQQLVGIHHSM